MTPENLQSAHKKLQEQIDAFSKNFAQERKMKKQQNLKQTAKLMNENKKEFLSDPAVSALGKMLQEKLGYKIGNADISENDIQKFYDWMESEEGHRFAQKIDSVITNDELKALGIDFEKELKDFAKNNGGELPPDFLSTVLNQGANNESNQQQKEQEEEPLKTNKVMKKMGIDQMDKKTANPIPQEQHNPLYNSASMDNFKHYVKKQAEKDPYVAELFQKQLGVNVEQVMDEFETMVKSGKIYEHLRPDQVFELLKDARQGKK